MKFRLKEAWRKPGGCCGSSCCRRRDQAGSPGAAPEDVLSKDEDSVSSADDPGASVAGSQEPRLAFKSLVTSGLVEVLSPIHAHHDRHDRHAPPRVDHFLQATAGGQQPLAPSGPHPVASRSVEAVHGDGSLGGLFELAPVDAVVSYFGPGIAIYFGWMNFFTVWLCAPAALGLLLYCHKANSDYTVDDHPAIPFFSIFVVLWSVAFLSFWDRRSNQLAFDWGVHGEERREAVRPEYNGEYIDAANHWSHHPQHVDSEAIRNKRREAYAFSFLVTSCMLSLAFMAMIW